MAEFDFLKAERWHYFHDRRRVPLFVDLWTNVFADGRYDIGFDYRVRFIGHVNHKVIVDERSFDRQRTAILAELERDPWFLYRYLVRAQRECDVVYKPTLERFLTTRVDESSPTTTLVHQLSELREVFARYLTYGILPLYVEPELVERARDVIVRHVPADLVDAYLNDVSVHVRPTILEQERRSLLQLAIAVKGGADPESLLGAHTEQFSWLANQLYRMTFYNLDHYRRELTDTLASDPASMLAKLDDELTARQRAYNEVVSLLDGDEQAIAAVQTLEEAVYYRNFRGERMYESSRCVAPLLTEVGRRLGLTLPEVVWFTVPELISALQGSTISRSKLVERQSGFALLTNVADGAVITGARLAALKQVIHLDRSHGPGEPRRLVNSETSEVEEERASLKADVLHGHSAYPGVVRGRVIVIHDLADLHRVVAGDVLVAPSTTPAFVPALRRVAAVVTEEGGVLCHAAMVARELKVPTIIGVRSATTALADGEMVEVDAMNGTVKRMTAHP